MLKTLQLFNEKAAKLANSPYTKWIQNNPTGFRIRVDQQGTRAEIRGPEQETVDAFVLTLRFFIQDNESISIRRMATLYASSTISDDIKERVQRGRASLNQFRSHPSTVQMGDEIYTRWRIFDVFVYGDLVHANEEKRALFKQWSKDPILFPILFTEFHAMMVELLRFIFWMQGVNQEAINQLLET